MHTSSGNKIRATSYFHHSRNMEAVNSLEEELFPVAALV